MDTIKCLLTDEWIKMCIYIYMYVYTHTHTHTHTQWNITQPLKRIMLFAATWMEPEIITLSKPKKDKYHMISLICGI